MANGAPRLVLGPAGVRQPPAVVPLGVADRLLPRRPPSARPATERALAPPHRQELAGAAYPNWGSADEEARGRLAAPEREAAEARDAELGKLATELRRIRASRPEEFELLPGCERARRFLAEYEASGPTAEAEALVRQAAREAAEALSALVADVPDVAHRDSRGEPWAPRLRPVDREAR